MDATPRLRADAHRNRERIVNAAREVVVEYGTEARLDEIARRAGVGNATLYRHFTDRTELIRQVMLSVMERIADQADVAVAEEPDAFEALRRFVHSAADERIGALCPLLSHGFVRTDPEIAEKRGRLDRAIEGIMERARRSGQLRTDVAVTDLLVALSQLTRPLPGTPCPGAQAFVHRHLQLFLDGLSAPARSVLPGADATVEGPRPVSNAS
jgi:AcrR family transcriptional regulator